MLPLLLIALAQVPAETPDHDAMPWLFGELVALCGDLDGDGRSEFAIGGRNPSAIYIYRGVDGTPLRVLKPQSNSEYLSMGYCTLGDIDGDGVNDMAVSIGAEEGRRGRVELRSGRTNNTVRTVLPAADEECFGQGLTNVGDVDHDGFDDIVVSAFHPAPWHEWTGMCWIVFSGATGKRLRVVEWQGPRTNGWDPSRANAAATALGDVDGDAVPDFAVIDEYRIRVISGASANQIHEFSLPYQFAKRGDRYSVCGNIDIDCDGRNEIVVGTPYISGRNDEDPFTFVRIYSGRTGGDLRSITLPASGAGFGYGIVAGPSSDREGERGLWVVQHNPFVHGLFVVSERSEIEKVTSGGLDDHWNYGWSIAGGGDVDADGVEDFIVGCHSPYSAGMSRSGAHVYSGGDRREIYEIVRGVARSETLKK